MTTHDRQTVLDAALLPPRMRDTIISGYRELEAENRRLGLHDLAAYCSERAEALAWGGRISLGEDVS